MRCPCFCAITLLFWVSLENFPAKGFKIFPIIIDIFWWSLHFKTLHNFMNFLDLR